MKNKFKQTSLIVLLFTLIFSACGQVNKPQKPTAFNSTLKSLQIQSMLKNEDSDYSCPPDENVVVRNGMNGSGYDYSGSFNFTVCMHRDDKNSFRVLRAPNAKNICIFPISYKYDLTLHTYTKKLISTPVCVDLTTEAFADIAFANASEQINYIRISEANFKTAMTNCILDSSGQTTCPTNAEGLIQ